MITISKERKEAYVEVLEILKHMDKKYIEKIPEKLVQFFKDNCSTDYNFILDVPIKEKELKKETTALLAMLNLNYWCEDEEHKKELLSKYYENEVRIQEEFLEKYSYENLFKKRKETTEEEDSENECSMEIIETKPSFIKKIFNIIKAIFKR